MRWLSSASWLIAVSIFAFTGVAAAAEPQDPWTGGYVGVNLGYSWGGTSTDYLSRDPASGLTETNHDSIHMNDVIGGGQVGYNYRLNQNYVLGIEADIQGSGESGGNTVQVCHPGGVAGAVCDLASNIYDSYTESLEWFGTVRPRLGFLPRPDLLIYGTGGFAYGRLTRNDTYTYNDTFFCTSGNLPNCTPQSNSVSGIKPGWVIGAGVEGILGGQWKGRIEYLHMELAGLGTSNFALTSGNPSPINLTTTSHSFTDDILRLAINYSF